MKALGSSIEGWKHQMNDAGAQAAAVLALVQSDGSEIRYRHSIVLLCLCFVCFQENKCCVDSVFVHVGNSQNVALECRHGN